MVLCQTTELLPVDRTDTCIDANIANNISVYRVVSKESSAKMTLLHEIIRRKVIATYKASPVVVSIVFDVLI